MIKVEANTISLHKKRNHEGLEMAMVVFVANLNNGKKESVTRHIPVNEINAYKAVIQNRYNGINTK